MEKMKTLEERYADDVLMDNTKLPKFEQCRDCVFRRIKINGNTIDDYRRGSCAIYPAPKMKPMELYRGKEPCEYYEKEKR